MLNINYEPFQVPCCIRIQTVYTRTILPNYEFWLLRLQPLIFISLCSMWRTNIITFISWII